MESIHLGVAFAAGFASFISPCCLPLYPSYLSYITGLSLNTLKTEGRVMVRARVMSHTLAFLLGLSLVFYSLGFGAGAIGVWFNSYRDWIRLAAGCVMILMGLVLSGLFTPSLLMREWKPAARRRPAGYAGAVLLGIGFAAGWSPCVGPVLASIIAMATSEPTAWFQLMTAYTAGFALPFLGFAFSISSIRRLIPHAGWIMKAGGGVLAGMGILLLSNQLTLLTVWLQRMTPDWLIF